MREIFGIDTYACCPRSFFVVEDVPAMTYARFLRANLMGQKFDFPHGSSARRTFPRQFESMGQQKQFDLTSNIMTPPHDPSKSTVPS